MKTIMTILLFAFSNIVYAQFTDYVGFNGDLEVSYSPTSFFGPQKTINNHHSGVSYLFNYRNFSKIDTKIYLGSSISTLNVYKFDSVAGVFGDCLTFTPHIEFERKNFILNLRYRYKSFRGRILPKFRKIVIGTEQSSVDHQFDIGIGRIIPISTNHIYIGLNIGRNSHRFFWGTNPEPIVNTPIFSLDIKQRIAVTDILNIKRTKSFTPYFGNHLISSNMKHDLCYKFFDGNSHYYNGFTDFYIGKFVGNNVILGLNFNNEYRNTGGIFVCSTSFAPDIHYMLFSGWHLNSKLNFSFVQTDLRYTTIENTLGIGTFFGAANDALMEINLYVSNKQYFNRAEGGENMTKFKNRIAGGLSLKYYFVL